MKIENVKISVIVPVYNVEKFLPECLNSLIDQTHKNFEVLLVDDGATDHSADICDNYAKKDNRIRVFHKKNGGLSDARNYALTYITGDYIAFIDSDDYVHKEYLETLIKNCISNDADISICNYKIVEEGEILTDKNMSNQSFCFTKEESMQQILHGRYIMQFCVAWGKIYKKEIFDDIKYPFGKKYEDVAVAHLCYNKATKVVYTEDQLYYYLHRKGSIKNSGRLKDTDVVDSAYDRLVFFETYNSGKYFIECKKQYLTAIMGTYSRLADTANEMKATKKGLLEEYRSFLASNKSDLLGIDLFSLRCILFNCLPDVYSKLLLLIKHG